MNDLPWTADALCAQTDPDLFFPEPGAQSVHQTRAAKKVCGSCGVVAECLAYALNKNIDYGVWGGMSPRQRRPFRKDAA